MVCDVAVFLGNFMYFIRPSRRINKNRVVVAATLGYGWEQVAG